MASEPLLVSLGVLPDLSDAKVTLASILRDRLRLLSRKVFSNRQWRQHWIDQNRAATKMISLYGELLSEATDAGERAVATAQQNCARDWVALAEAKASNQDAFLTSIEMEHDSVEERLESTLLSASRTSAEPPRTAPAVGATPFEVRAMRLAELRFRQTLQSERRVLAATELKLIQQQVTAGTTLQPALARDVELARKEHRITAAQLLSPNPHWSGRWAPIAAAAAAKLTKIEEELDLSGARQHSLRFDVSLAESQIAYRDQKHGEITVEIEEAEAVSGWLSAVFETVWQRAPRVIGLLLLIIFVGWIALRIVRLVARAFVKVVQDDDPDRVSAAEQRAGTIAAVFTGVGKIAVYVVCVLIACDVVGVDTGPILGSVAILGLALSFGSQNLVRDFVNGFFVLVENQYAVGDWVKIGAYEGDVEQINIRSTRLRSVTGVLQIIPNGTISTVENMTRDWACFRCHVGVSYDSDIDLVERICNEVGAEMHADPELKAKLLEAPTFVGVTELADSAVVVRSSAKTQPGAQWGLEREMNRRLKKAFAEGGIEIPFPQQVVWHRNKADE
jgi:small conductance mechanosensitive channel